MPQSLQYLLWAAAGLTACGVIYRTAIRPVTKGVAEMVKALPVLQEVVEQVRNDGGSSLKDTTNRIDARADANEKLVKEVAARLEAHTESVADRLATVTETTAAAHAAQNDHMAAQNDRMAAQNDRMEKYMHDAKHSNDGFMGALITILDRDNKLRTRATDAQD